jgi:chromosome partitioning protein
VISIEVLMVRPQPHIIHRRIFILPQVVISIANQKGGVGKTMTAVNLAAGLASILRRSKTKSNALIIDIDHQASATPYFIKNSTIDPMSTVFKLYQEEEADSASDIIHPTRFPCLSIVPSSNELSINELFMASFNGAPHRLKKFIQRDAKDYNVIIIDCPPSFNIYVMSSFIASNYILMPLTPLPESFDGIALMYKFLQNTPEIRDHIKILGYIITMLRERNTVHSSYKAAITQRFEDELLGEIHDSADLGKSAVLKNLISESAKGSRAYKEYTAVSRRVFKLIANQLKIGIDVNEDDA